MKDRVNKNDTKEESYRSLFNFPSVILSSIYDQLNALEDKTNFLLINKKHNGAAQYKHPKFLSQLSKLTKLKELTEFNSGYLLVSFDSEINLNYLKKLYSEYSKPILVKLKDKNAIFVYGSNNHLEDICHTELIPLAPHLFKNIVFPEPLSYSKLQEKDVTDDICFEVILKTRITSPHDNYDEDQLCRILAQALNVTTDIISSSNYFPAQFIAHAHLLKNTGIINSNLKKKSCDDVSRFSIYGLWSSKLRIELEDWTLLELLSLTKIYNEAYGIEMEVKEFINPIEQRCYYLSMNLDDFCRKVLPFLSPSLPFKSNRPYLGFSHLLLARLDETEIDARYLLKLSLKDQETLIIKQDNRIFLFLFFQFRWHLTELDKNLFEHIAFPGNGQTKRLQSQYVSERMSQEIAQKKEEFVKNCTTNHKRKERDESIHTFFNNKNIKKDILDDKETMSCMPF